MDAPVDFTLDRARLLGSNLNSSSLGTYEGAYVDSGHASALSRSAGLSGSHASLQDLARVGTPSSMSTLGQYQGRYLHPSIAIPSPGASYAMMGNFLNGGGSSADHLKSLMPAELQQYWSSHGEGCGTRYIINNNNIYSPYLSYLPATESLSLFAHNVGTSAAVQGQGQSAYHRIYDLHKDALYNVAPLGASQSSLYGAVPPSRISPPSSRITSDILAQTDKGPNKKEVNSHSRFSDSKKSVDLSSKHLASKTSDSYSKNTESHTKNTHTPKHSKDVDKKECYKKEDNIEVNSKTKATKDTNKKEEIKEVKKQEKCSDSKQNEGKKKGSLEGKDSEKQSKHLNESVNPELESSKEVDDDASGDMCHSAEDKNKNKKSSAKLDKKDDATVNQSTAKLDSKDDTQTKSQWSQDIIVPCSSPETKMQSIPTMTTVTLTPSESMTSVQSSNNLSSRCSPDGTPSETSTGPTTMVIAPTSTTFSLPYYHSIYSHSQPPGTMDGKKVHAPTYTPEIGTLPSVPIMASIPIQTTACDMRIKKETTPYSCCKEMTSNNTLSPKSHCSAKLTSPKSDSCDRSERMKRHHDSLEQKVKRGHSKSIEAHNKISAKTKERKENALDCSINTLSPSSLSPQSKKKDSDICDSESKMASVISPCISPKDSSKLCSSVKSPPLDSNNLSAFKAVNRSVDSAISRSRIAMVTENTSRIGKSNYIGDKSLVNRVSPSDKSTEQNVTRNSHKDSAGFVKNNDTLLTTCQENKSINRKLDNRTTKHRSLQIENNGCRKSKLPNLASGKVTDGNGREKIGNLEEIGTTGMNIPVGIAVAQKREELKKEDTDVNENSVGGDSTSNGLNLESQNGTVQHGDGHQNIFGTSKSNTPQDSISEMRNQLPANLIVTGSATGAGVAWSEDPAARHFANHWMQTGHTMNPSSWIGQMSYTLPSTIPTSTIDANQQLPVSIPPGYKLVQDSVTGQFVVIPPPSLDLYDPSRMWSSFSSTGHSGTLQQFLAAQTQLQHHVMTNSQDRQPTTDFALAVQHYQQQLQQMYQARQEAVMTCQDLSQGGAAQSSSGQTSDTFNHKEVHTGHQTDKEKLTNGQNNIPDANLERPSPLPEVVAIKTEMSSVQSRGTSPMVPASEIEDASQETIDAASTHNGSDYESSPNKNSNIGAVQTCASDTCGSSSSSIGYNSTDEKENSSNTNSGKTACTDVNKSETCQEKDNGGSDKAAESSDKSTTVSGNIKGNSIICDNIVSQKPSDSLEKNQVIISGCEQKVTCDTGDKSYNPFLDPLILQAADGLELLSALAEKRAKCEEVANISPNIGDNRANISDVSAVISDVSAVISDSSETIGSVSANVCNVGANTSNVCSKENVWGKSNDKNQQKDEISMFSEEEPKVAKRKHSISRTRSVHITKPEPKVEPPSYYTSTGLRIPQGEEEINAIELDMRIRLAELQRQYKEKQREFARLTPKRDKTDKEKDKEKDDNSKRGPGRPRKRTHSSSSSPKNETSQVKQGTVKAKEPPIKKKKQAEELVDRVFRKTGGGFGMPLSKKLKASAMAALYKTQSGFTMKRKGSTSSSSSVSPHSSPVKFSSIIKKEKLSIKSPTHSSEGKGKIKSLQKSENKPTKKSAKDSCPIEKNGRGEDAITNGKSLKPSKKCKDKSVDETTSNTSQIPKTPKQKDKDDKSVESNCGLGMLAKYATSALNEHVASTKIAVKRKLEEGVCDEKPINNTESSTVATNTKLKDSDAEASSDSTSPSNKKRKPGRPRKCDPNKTHGVTETIVAKNSKNFRFYQLQKFEDMWNAGVSQPKPKLEDKTPMKPLFLDEEWMLRRSERIFLSDPSPQPSPNFSYKETLKPSPTPSPQKQTPVKSKSEKAKLQKAKNIHDLSQRVKKKYSKALKAKKQSKEAKEKKESRHIHKKKAKKPISKEIISDSDSSSDGDNIPLSALRDRPVTPAPRSCVINQDELKDRLRVLLFKDGLFYEGAVQEIRPPDVYGVIIDNARGNRPLIYSQEEILKDAIVDVKAPSSRCIPEGTRVCAYWSQQFSCLYPGTVSKASPNPHADKNFINLEFDDGDSGRIPLDHIRMIPEDFPLVSYDPNPLLLIGKRRRHTTSDSIQSFSSDYQRQDSLPSNDTKPKIKRGPGRPPKQKTENGFQNSESQMSIDDEEDIDVCGLEDDHDDVFTSPTNTGRTQNIDNKTYNSSKGFNKKKQSDNSEKKSSHDKNKDKKVKVKDESAKSSKKKEKGKHKHLISGSSDVFSFKQLPPWREKLLLSTHQTINERLQNDSKASEGSVDPSNQLISEYSSSEDDSSHDCSSVQSVKSTTSNPRKQNGRSLSADSKSKIAAFLPARQLWRWSGKSTKRPGLKGKAKKEFYKSIVRGKEVIALGDCAVFLSTGRPHFPYIGRIISLWEAWGGQMVVKVKWFYHPEETRGGKKLQDMKGALFQSPHIDENDVQTISHKCDVLSFTEYKKRHLEEKRRGEHKTVDDADIYYLAGTYEPTIGLLKFQDDIM